MYVGEWWLVSESNDVHGKMQIFGWWLIIRERVYQWYEKIQISTTASPLVYKAFLWWNNYGLWTSAQESALWDGGCNKIMKLATLISFAVNFCVMVFNFWYTYFAGVDVTQMWKWILSVSKTGRNTMVIYDKNV